MRPVSDADAQGLFQNCEGFAPVMLKNDIRVRQIHIGFAVRKQIFFG
jgi:hypothetical protein